MEHKEEDQQKIIKLLKIQFHKVKGRYHFLLKIIETFCGNYYQIIDDDVDDLIGH